MNSLREVFYNKAMQGFLTNKKIISDYCKKCKYLNICKGGCPRLEKAIYLNDKETFCGYEDFLDHTIDEMLSISNALLR